MLHLVPNDLIKGGGDCIPYNTVHNSRSQVTSNLINKRLIENLKLLVEHYSDNIQHIQVFPTD